MPMLHVILSLSSFGFKELEGIHSRTDFDLKDIKNIRVEKYNTLTLKLTRLCAVCVETSIGLDRMFLTILSHSYQEEEVNSENRLVLSIPPILSPVKAAVLPLTKKDGLPEKAKEILKSLQYDFNCQYEEKDSIGKRYRRQDAIGTPYCITVDHQSLEDQTVTIRDRDTMQQQRIAIEHLHSLISKKVGYNQN